MYAGRGKTDGRFLIAVYSDCMRAQPTVCVQSAKAPRLLTVTIDWKRTRWATWRKHIRVSKTDTGGANVLMRGLRLVRFSDLR